MGKILHKIRWGMRPLVDFDVMFLVTFFITLLFAFLVVNVGIENDVIQYQDVVNEKYAGNVMKFLNSNDISFSFGQCNGLDLYTYCLAKLMEALIPTCLTFFGLILIDQKLKRREGKINAALFTCLTGFALVGAFFMVSKEKTFLSFYLKIEGILIYLLMMLSILLYRRQERPKRYRNGLHKSEKSDGRVSG